MNPKSTPSSIWVLLLAAAVIRILFAVESPAWWSPDEYAHYWVAEHIALEGSLPTSSPVFPQYESYQPPLYYLLASLTIRVNPGELSDSEEPNPPPVQLILLRLCSVLISVVTIWIAYLIFRRIPAMTSEDKLLAVAFMAFLPTYVGTSASVNNDTLMTLLSTVSLYYAMNENPTGRTIFGAGFWAGAAILTKMNAIVLVPFILYRVWQTSNGKPGESLRRAIPALLGWSIGASILFIRNLVMYNDLLAMNPGIDRQLDLSPGNILRAIRNLSWSFWLAFGRRYRITPVPAVYILTALPLMLAAATGWVKSFGQRRRLASQIGLGIGLAITASLCYTLGYPAGNMTSWGKNLFVVLPLISIFMVTGWRTFSPRLGTFFPRFGILLLVAGSIWGLIKVVSL